MKYELSPSILSADFARLGEEIKAVEQTGVNYLHIDVMDGMFVPSISFGFPIIKSIRKMSNMVFDVHLMVEQPERYIEETAASGADIITIHAEACKHPDRAIEQIHQLGKKAGIALNPSTSLHELDSLLEKVDMVLLMTVNPGFGNQKYIPYCTGKVKELRTMIEERGLQTDIEVDGGINAATIDAVLEAGANILVAGSAVFGKETAKNAEKYRKLLADYQEFTDLVTEAKAIVTDTDARYAAFAKAEASMLNNALCIPCLYEVLWCLTHVNEYTKINAMYGPCNYKAVNWETRQGDGYTTEEYEAFSAAFNAATKA